MIVVADSGAILALIDRKDKHHKALTHCIQHRPARWVLPWAVLPEVDYLVARELSRETHATWLADLAAGLWDVEPMLHTDLVMAEKYHQRYRALSLGLVDAVVAVVAERLKAEVIATVDLKHFGAISIPTAPLLWPRDL